MKYNLDENPKHVIFKLEEEKLNSLIAPDIKAEIVLLINKGTKNLIFDLSNVKFVDSSGLSSILIAHRLCNNVNGAFVLSCLQDSVIRLIQISQLDNIINITSTTSDAIDFIAAQENN